MLKLSFSNNLIEAGCDEAGRGCLAGPVFAAAVILPADFADGSINDSKLLSAKQRKYLRQIIEKNAIGWAVEFIDNVIIDEINILNASILAMHKALDKTGKSPELILIDGNRFKSYKNIPHKCIIKGDSEYLSIASASILAKTYRDDYMEELNLQFPQYNWTKNKGYATKDHIEALRIYGQSPYHRKTFHLKEQLKLQF